MSRASDAALSAAEQAALSAAEQAVLGALLLENAARSKVNGLAASHFETEQHRLIFEAITDELDDGGQADAVTVYGRLARNGKADRAGGLNYLNRLATETPSAANVAAYAEIVEKRARQRQQIDAARDLLAAAERGDDAAVRLALARLAKIAEDHEKASADPMLDELAGRVWHLPPDWHLFQPPARPFVMHPYIPRRAVSALLGAGTSSKTMLVTEWSAAIMTGSDWRGHATQEGDVVVCTWEDEGTDYHAKLHALVNARPDLLPFADLIRTRFHVINLRDPKYRLVAANEQGKPAPTILAHNLADLVRRDFPDTVQVFIETVSRANGTDETNEAFAAVVAAGEVIATDCDAGVTAVHHVSKAALVNGVLDATAGRGGSSLADNCRATTVLALLTADMAPAALPPGLGADDVKGREIVVVENSRSSYGRKADRIHLERIYPVQGAPYLRAIQTPTAIDGPKRDEDAEKLVGWLQDERRHGKWLTKDSIVTRFDEFGLSERKAGTALERLAEDGVIEKDATGKQYGDKGRPVTRYRYFGPSDK